MPKAVCHWPLKKVEAQVRYQGRLCEIWDGQSGTGTGFLLSTSVFSVSIILPMLHTHLCLHIILIRRTSRSNLETFRQKQPSFRHLGRTGPKGMFTLFCSDTTGLRLLWHKCRPQKSICIPGCIGLFQVELFGTCSSSWTNPLAVSQQPVSGPMGCSTVAPCLATTSTQALRSVRKPSL
jgi:hypothetical protein